MQPPWVTGPALWALIENWKNEIFQPLAKTNSVNLLTDPTHDLTDRFPLKAGSSVTSARKLSTAGISGISMVWSVTVIL